MLRAGAGREAPLAPELWADEPIIGRGIEILRSEFAAFSLLSPFSLA